MVPCLEQPSLPRPDYFDGGAKFMAPCLNFDKYVASGKIKSQIFNLHMAKWIGKLWI